MALFVFIHDEGMHLATQRLVTMFGNDLDRVEAMGREMDDAEEDNLKEAAAVGLWSHGGTIFV